MDRSPAQLTLTHAIAPSTQRLPLALLAAYMLSMPVYALVRLSGDSVLLSANTALTAALLFAFSLAHAMQTRGALRTAGMVAAAFAIALTMEYLGSKHGLIFGAYTYTDLLGPKALGQVPLIIPIAWFMMLYPSWAVAGLLTQSPLMRAALAAGAMTAWDLSLDPRMVADGAWVWHEPGALNYFGIPLSNFAGWFLTAGLIYLVWLALDRAPGASPASAVLPAVAYAVVWLGESVANALFWSGPLVALCVFLAMGLFAVSALVRLWRSLPLVLTPAAG